MSSPIFRFDLTVSCDRVVRPLVDEFCKNYCKKFVYQQEQAESGYLHFQMRVSLNDKIRMAGLIRLLNDRWGEGWGHASPTSSACKGFDYAMKQETRVAGPWSDRDVPVYIPKAFRYPELRGWQSSLMERLEGQNDRQICFVTTLEANGGGNEGKSWMTSYLELCKGYKLIFPTAESAKDILEQAYGQIKDSGHDGHNFCVDIPRAMSPKHMRCIAQALEILKTGRAYDRRYKFQMWRFEPPTIVVFTNFQPDMTIFSSDRYDIFNIEDHL